MDLERILQYQKTISPKSEFKVISNKSDSKGFPNKFYYPNVINHWHDQRLFELGENNSLKGRKKLLKWFLLRCKLLLNHTMELYILVYQNDKTDSNKIFHAELKLKKILKNIASIEESIEQNYITGEYDSAIKIQEYCRIIYKEVLKVINDQLYIKILESPMKSEIEQADFIISESIDIEKITLIQKENNTLSKTRRIIDNPNTTIFKDGISFQIFNDIHKEYSKDKKHFKANYSFLFLAMNKDGFLVCNGPGWIGFLANNYDIVIDKIDYRQSGLNSKSPFYNSIKSSRIAQE
ncbi:MAG: hypothetical protein ABJJ25_15255 [Eudoraea sp.]|uniref:hypothetical protein n=1 Tax=Eudoraea sp. TaxID=1979955 RepID=UPI003267AA4B